MFTLRNDNALHRSSTALPIDGGIDTIETSCPSQPKVICLLEACPSTPVNKVHACQLPPRITASYYPFGLYA
uniref:Uncharacterized protein n=1 Tax=Timema genevievae TaxID=629358 RepID=A0A7R9JQ74_TIMGE|nr:unnamed protein product [Timema genevievae]